jgi:PPOX class probable F420-dependent enzyme
VARGDLRLSRARPPFSSEKTTQTVVESDKKRMGPQPDGQTVAYRPLEGMGMTTLDDVVALGRLEQFLVVVSTARADGTIQSSLVNAGVIPHPVTGDAVLALVTYGPAKLRNLRARPQITVTVRSGWQWATVEGRAELIGPDDPHPGVDPERLRLLLREVFTAAGGTHDDWDAYDAEMVEQHRTAVLITPTRVYSN